MMTLKSGRVGALLLASALSLAACGDKDGGNVASPANKAASAAAGQSWLTVEKGPNNDESFQGSAILIMADATSDNDLVFKGSRIELRCPGNFGHASNQVWQASVDIPLDVPYENGKERGTMAIDVDGKAFSAVQFTRTQYKVKPEEAEAFRDAMLTGKKITFTPKTLDGRTGTGSADLPDGATLKTYFVNNCGLVG